MTPIADFQKTLVQLQEHCLDFQGMRLICVDGDKLVYDRDRDYPNGDLLDEGSLVAIFEHQTGVRMDLIPVDFYLSPDHAA